MASTWTDNIAIEKIADGEKTDTWGQVTNRNLDIIDKAINGIVETDVEDVTALNLDIDNGTTTPSGTVGDAISSGVNKILEFISGDDANDTATCTVTIRPNDVKKLYFINNKSVKQIDFTQGTGDNASVNAGGKGIIYCDGTGAAANVVTLAQDLSLVADITTIGTSEASKAVTADANGDVKFANAIVETVHTVTGTSSDGVTTADLDPNNGTVQTMALTEDTTFTESFASGESISLHLTSASSYTVTWPTITWVSRGGDLAPTLTAADTVILFKISTTLYGVWIGSSA